MRIGLDVMGGDLAPDPILKGGLDAVSNFSSEDRLVLFGDEAVLRAGVEHSGVDASLIEIVGSTQLIGMDESPVEAVRSKGDSSIVKLCQMASVKAGDARLDAVISAGNTGAFVAASQMFMRRLPNVVRPGIAAVVPTFGGPVVFIDVGANIESQARAPLSVWRDGFDLCPEHVGHRAAESGIDECRWRGSQGY